MMLPDRFWAKVDITPDHWLWTAGTNEGYGRFAWHGRQVYAHRASFEAHHRALLGREQVDHKCRLRLCVNPWHLQAVTRQLNSENLDGAHRDSSSGIRGVTWDKAREQWAVRVSSHGRHCHGGRFDRLADAEAAAIELRNQMMTNNLADREAA